MRIEIPYILRQQTEGIERIEVPGKTVRECLTALKKKYPGIESHLFDESGNLFKHFNLFIDSRNINNLDLEVKDENVLIMLFAIDGG